MNRISSMQRKITCVELAFEVATEGVIEVSLSSFLFSVAVNLSKSTWEISPLPSHFSVVISFAVPMDL